MENRVDNNPSLEYGELEKINNEHTFISIGSFGWAIEAMKRGEKVCRRGWNGKGMWIALGKGQDNLPAKDFWNEHSKQQAVDNGGSANVLPYILFCTAQGDILMGWLASQTDMLSEDWEIQSYE